MTCKECEYFFDMSGTGSPILDECACFCPPAAPGEPRGKNYFADMETCENFKKKTL